MGDSRRLAELYLKKWRWYERNSLPWNRLAIHREFMRREAFVRWPVHGNVLESFRAGRLELGTGVLFEPGVWVSILPTGRFVMGDHSGLNRGVFISAVELIEIGAHSFVGNGAFITDGQHRHGDLSRPFTWQGMKPRGPTIIGENVWIGVNVVITGNVTIGERSIVGANSVVTSDIPSHTIAAGVPARVIREIDFDELAAAEGVIDQG